MTRQTTYDMDTVKGRLLSYIRHAGLTQAEFAARLGVSPAYIGAMRRGLSRDKASRLGEVFPDLNRDWLLYGEGEMLVEGVPSVASQPRDTVRPKTDRRQETRPEPKTEQRADIRRTVSDRGVAPERASGGKTGGVRHDSGRPERTPHMGEGRETPRYDRSLGPVVPLLPVQAFAGNLQDWSNPVRLMDCEKIVSPVAPVDFAIRISGDSMEPEFSDGTTLFIRRITDRNFMPWGHPVVIDSSNGVIFKLIYPPREEDPDEPYIEAQSLNPRYPPLRIGCDTILGIYRVCAAIRIYNTI